MLNPCFVGFSKFVIVLRTLSLSSGILLINMLCSKSVDCSLLGVHNHHSRQAFHSLWSNKRLTGKVYIYLMTKACHACLLVVAMQLNLPNKNQRLLRAISWYELFASLSNLRSGVLCKGYTFVRILHVPAQLLFVRRD